jgi:uncharacterized protein YoxC
MKTLVTIILILACAGLVVALIITQKHIDQQQKENADKILYFSNEVVQADGELDDLRQVNLMLTNALNSSREQLSDMSNQVVMISGSLSNSDTQLKSAQDQIASLEAQNQALGQQAVQLTNTIDNLDAKIAEAKTQLSESETNNTFLLSELNDKEKQRRALEQEFNDLSVVRTQAKKLHNELVMERRLQWIRQGTQPNSGVKGAQLLMARSWPTNQLVPPSHYNLAVEVESSGAVRIVSDTNAPAGSNTSPQ